MITIFNRKEVLITLSIEKQADIRTILVDNNIAYVVNTYNNSGPIAGGRFGENPNYSLEYRIFVNKKDYDKANFLIRKAML